jgi:hypothetical protein
MRGGELLNIHMYAWFNTSKPQWLLNVQSVLTPRNSTFCPPSVCMCLLWIRAQTAIICGF